MNPALLSGSERGIYSAETLALKARPTFRTRVDLRTFLRDESRAPPGSERGIYSAETLALKARPTFRTRVDLRAFLRDKSRAPPGSERRLILSQGGRHLAFPLSLTI